MKVLGSNPGAEEGQICSGSPDQQKHDPEQTQVPLMDEISFQHIWVGGENPH